MAEHRRWSPEEIAQMREELQTMTLAQVGQLHGGITRERVRQLAGNVNRKHPPRDGGWENPLRVQTRALQARIAELARAGLSDEHIGCVMEINPSTVAKYRQGARVLRYNQHTPESMLWCLHKWVELFGYVPSATDWNSTHARNQGHKRRALRFEQFRIEYGCPWFKDCQKHFGSWANFIEAGGYPRPYSGSRRPEWRTAPLLSELDIEN